MMKNMAAKVSAVILATYGVTIPWEMIFELVAQLIAQCFENDPRAFRAAAKNPDAETRLIMNIMVRRTLGVWGRKKVVAIQEACFMQAAEMSDGDLDACHAEIVGRLNYDMDPSNEPAEDTAA